jgi:2,4-dienoyl-CoA reductase (NADPH2)
MGELVGGCTAGTDHDRDVPEVDLLSPLAIRGVTLRNRIAMSPMCQYSAVDGMPDDWHLVHLGSRAAGGVGLVVVEATAITADGRISPGDLGIWSDAHAEAFRRIATFVKSQGAVAGMQLAHAGRKASCDVPWRGGAQLGLERGGWETRAPSAVAFQDGERVPRELAVGEIDAIVDAFEAAARRGGAAGGGGVAVQPAPPGPLLAVVTPPADHPPPD